jgi:hypothetical protein
LGVILVGVLGIVSVAWAADRYVGQVQGVGINYSDSGSAQCCEHLSTYHSGSGDAVDMDRQCRALGGDVVKNKQQNGYCRTYAAPSGSGYKYECSAAMSGDCYAW